jgi:uncharacterized protein (TIGR03067 family)
LPLKYPSAGSIYCLPILTFTPEKIKMKKISLVALLLCGLITAIAQNNKKLLIGKWQVERFEMEGKEVFNRSNNAAAFASYKSMAFGDTTVLSEADSLVLLETVREAEKNIGSLSLSFDAKGNHITNSLDDKTKKMTASKGIYKFAPDDDTKLMIKMGKPTNQFETSMILELTATTLTISELTEGVDAPLIMSFKRIPAAQVKKPVKR